MLSRSDNPTLIDLLKHAAEKNPGGLCLSMDGVKCSFSDLYQRSLKRAECFTNLGAQNGDKVGILLPNGIEYLEIFDEIIENINLHAQEELMSAN